MKQNSFSKKRIIHAFVVLFILVMTIALAILLMFKYNVEGEKNLPFNLKKINIVSTAESNISKDEEDVWHAGIMQKNDIFFVIEKNPNYKKEDTIKNVKLENFKVVKQNENMIVDIYKSVKPVNYSEEYKIEDSLEYIGGQSTNTETMQINNQGGLIELSLVSSNLGEYIFNEDEKLPSDGRLLAKAGVKSEDINFTVSFDLIIETESEHKFKSSIVLELPTGNILQEGVGVLEDTQLTNVIFKRF